MVEGDRDAFVPRLLLQQLQQAQPSDGGEADAVEQDAFAAVMDRDTAPAFEFRRDGVEDRRIVLLQEFQRVLGKHHAEAEGQIRRILLDHAERQVEPARFRRSDKIKPGRPGADDHDPHVQIPAILNA